MTTTNPGNTRKSITPISPVESIREHLLQLKPRPNHGKEQAFADLYEDIRRLIAEKVTQRDILAVLASHGVKLSPTRFKELIRKHSGEPAKDTPRTSSAHRNSSAADKTSSQGVRAILPESSPVYKARFGGNSSDGQAEKRE